ncbi:hypothetical protein VOLCADRAFT_105379 [Volvox carteri f. nagariensis]|uniref:Uncharacterized protein n=1 Tax=Volvox carteri f. nagariensis TaxID=3068 RepID=D8U0G4_VOLCA|nr:uncharacterized protein VOLCADRAFT_105379 [Volvox carteri f. nagariensis]EFJ46629.1 hypothetical protein VOLCADRAFT_105379 [Volvox carteri f. nagariensis]|eukprot:XP_002952158.1 hypothetical protein VOLCADRAFT_105379 [Volvox carteri f. nagariensis]
MCPMGRGIKRLKYENRRRSGPHQPISPYLNSLAYGSHELLGGRRSAAGTSGGRGLAAGASAAVQEAHQRLERLLGPQQQLQGTGTSGSVKRPISAPLTFGAPIGATSGVGGSGSGAGGGASSSAAVSGSSGHRGTTSRPRPASASPLQSSGPKGFSSAGLAGGAPAGGSVSLLSTAPAAMCQVSSSSAASNHRVSSRRGHSAAEQPSSGVTGVISSGHNVAGASAADGDDRGAKARLKSPAGGRSTVIAKEALSEAVLGSSADVLLDGSASMPTLLPSSLASASGSGSGGGSAVVGMSAMSSGRGRSQSAALTTSSSEKLLGASRLSLTTTTGRSAGQSALRSASPSSSNSPKTSIAAGSGFGSGSHGSLGSATTGAIKSRAQTRRRESGGDPSGSSGTGVSSSGADGAGGGRTAMAAAGMAAGTTTTLKVGHVVDTGRTASGGRGSGSGSGGVGSRSAGPEGRTHRSGGSSHGHSGDGSKVRTATTGGERQHVPGPRSPTSPSGPAAGPAAAGKAVGGRSSSRSAVGSSGGAKTATPGGGSGSGSSKVAARVRRSSSGQHEPMGAATAGTSGGLAGEFVLTGTAGARGSGAASGGGGSTSSSSSSLYNGGAGGRPSSSERSRRRSTATNTTTTPTPAATTGRPGGVEAVAVAAVAGGNTGGHVMGPGAQFRDAAASHTSSWPSPMSLTGAASVSAAALGDSTGHRIKPPSIDLSALMAASAGSESTPGAGKHAAYGAVEPAKPSVAGAAAFLSGGRRASSGDFPAMTEARAAPPLSPTPAGSSGDAGRFQVPGYLDEQAAPPPLLLLPTRSPLQSPRSVLGLPRRSRGGLGSGSGGALWASGGGLPAASRWARSPPLPLPSDDSAALSAVCSGVMPPSAVVMHDLQASAHGLMLQGRR